MSRIFWDTNLFIYLFEAHPEFLQPTTALRKRMLERGDELLTSAMTLGEIQVKPRREGLPELAKRYREAIRLTSTVVPFDEIAADAYSQIRETSSVTSPDAIQLSCAAAAGVDFFISNDRRLQSLTIPGIGLVISLDRRSL